MTVGHAPDPLFDPIRINGTQVSNRFVMPAMQRGMSNYAPSSGLIDRLRRASEGGSGMIISEGIAPDHPAAYWLPGFGVLSEDTFEEWSRVAEAALSGGQATFLFQLWHPGALRLVVDDPPNPHADYPTLSPSGLVQAERPNGQAMTRGQLDETKQAYVEAARIAQRLGAHGVEVHSCHGYLLDLFLWAETNEREDEYGGATLAERARYPMEIVSAIRAATGPDFIISFRFSQWKEVDYGAQVATHPDELGPFLAGLEDAGTDVFNVSTRRFDSPEWPDLAEGRSLATWVKGMTSRPVIAVGSVGLSTDIARNLFDGADPELQVADDLRRAREGVARGDFDLIGVGRAQVANSNFVHQVRAGEFAAMQPFRRDLLREEYDGDFSAEGQLVEQSRKTD